MAGVPSFLSGDTFLKKASFLAFFFEDKWLGKEVSFSFLLVGGEDILEGRLPSPPFQISFSLFEAESLLHTFSLQIKNKTKTERTEMKEKVVVVLSVLVLGKENCFHCDLKNFLEIILLLLALELFPCGGEGRFL